MPVIHSLKGTGFIFTGELHSSIVRVILSSVVCLFPKKVGSTYASFKGTIIISTGHSQSSVIHSFNDPVYFSDVKICSHPILPTLSFRVFQNTSHRDINFLSKQLYF